MRTTFLTRLFITGAVLSGLCISFLIASQAYSNRIVHTPDPRPVAPIVTDEPRIQLAILLDTSSSMDGLIDQTRNQLWQMVDELSTAKQKGKTPRLEVAVFEYGNDGLPASLGHVRKVVGLTSELDRVSEALFSLSTNGGDEYCGYAIDSALKQLEWSGAADDLRMIFIAGNEPFTQGPISYIEAINKAKQHDITVSTIFAGEHQAGMDSGWQQGAALAGGNFMSIDHNHQIAHIDAPQDKEIAALNAKLNQTYIPFGGKGQESAARQIAQDSKNAEVSVGLLAKRAKAKVSSAYTNSAWDLVDAMEEGELDLDEVDVQSLPKPMQVMSSKQQKDYVASKKAEREELKQQIINLSEKRDLYVADKRKALDELAGPTVNDAIKSAVTEQAQKKQYTFK